MSGTDPDLEEHTMIEAPGRAAALLSRMTLTEKVAPLTSVMPTGLLGPEGLRPELAAESLANGIGYIEPHLGGVPRSATELARLNNVIQRYLVDHTRLGIPALMHIEALNGVSGPDFTSFPTPIAFAATWNPVRDRGAHW